MYYSEKGKAYSDYEVEKIVADLAVEVMGGDSKTIHFSTENMAYAIRLAVQSGKISSERLMLDMGNGDVKVDSDGRMKNSEKYNVITDKWLDMLLGIG